MLCIYVSHYIFGSDHLQSTVLSCVTSDINFKKKYSFFHGTVITSIEILQITWIELPISSFKHNQLNLKQQKHVYVFSIPNYIMLKFNFAILNFLITIIRAPLCKFSLGPDNLRARPVQFRIDDEYKKFTHI